MTKELKKLKDNFLKESKLLHIKESLDEFEKSVINFEYNPNTRAISVIYDIMDDIQKFQIKLRELKTEALKEELMIELCYNEAKNQYENRYNELLLEIKDNKFNNIKEKESYVKNTIVKEEVFEFFNFFENKKLKIKNILKRVDILLDNFDRIDNKVSRKITLMQIQKDLGTLVDLRVKK